MKADAIAAACSRLSREWGDRYTVESVTHGPVYGAATLHVVASDGSRFTVSADRYGVPLTADGVQYGWRDGRWVEPNERP